MGKYYKRIYRNPGEFFSDMTFLVRNSRRIRELMRGNSVPSAFRERLMLGATSVYGCRYCNWVHTREALRSGIEKAEVARMLEGSVDGCPEDEAVGVLYAQHWADSNGKPDAEAVRRLRETYGAQKAEAIDLTLRVIRTGNLTGNTWDQFLHRMSVGRLGGY